MDGEVADYWMLFAEEAREAFETAEECVLALEEGPSTEELNRLYRAMHSMKGSARTMGLTGTETVAHRAEDLVSLVRDHGVDTSPDWFDLILRSLDVLRALVRESVEAREDRSNVAASSLIEELAEFYGKHEPEREPLVPALPSENPGDLFLFTDEGDAVTVEAYGEPVEAREVVAVDTGPIDPAALAKVATPPLIANRPADPPPPPSTTAAGTTKTQLEAKRAPAAAGPRSEGERARGPAAADKFIRLPMGKVEQVMSLAGEIHLALGAILQSAEAAGHHNEVHRAEMLIQELQDATAGLGLTPVAAVLSRAKRLVRDLSRQTGKALRLDIEDHDTEIDRMLVDRIYEPLMHIIRNAADHGIEPPEERTEAGKPVVGTIRIEASQEGGQVRIRVEDDGRGIDVARVIARARERGVIAADHTPTDDQARQLIMAPGFSTAASVSNLSGRGVGMDVVTTTMNELGGSVHVDSVRGRGTTVDLFLPLTLAFSEVIVAELDDQLFGIPVSSVCSIFRPDASQVSTVRSEGSTFVRLTEELVPVHWLEQTNGGSPKPSCAEVLPERVVVAVYAGEGKLALPVERILGAERITMKPLPEAMGPLPFAAGCGVLRCGRVVVALDCQGLRAGRPRAVGVAA
ncbi:MAG: chemotaxis protein CheA [Myxococcota bacterium]